MIPVPLEATLFSLAAGMSLVELSAVVGIATAFLGTLYTVMKFGGERRAGRIAEEDFYQRMYKDLNETLLKEVERLRREVADRDTVIAQRDATIARLRPAVDPSAGA